jgi:hypothetical protein
MGKADKKSQVPIEATPQVAILDLDDKTTYNPQQELFLNMYCDPNSKTFGKLTASGKAAGYSQYQIKKIDEDKPDWFRTGLRLQKRKLMFEAAEDNVHEFLTMGHTSLQEDQYGNIVEKTDATKLKVKAEMTKYVTDRLGEGAYTQKQETKHVNFNVNVYKKLSELESLNNPNVINVTTTEGDQREAEQQVLADAEFVQVDRQEESAGNVSAEPDTDIVGLREALSEHNPESASAGDNDV